MTNDDGSGGSDAKHLRRFLDPSTKAGRLRSWAYRAIQQHRLDGTIPTSLRHLFYEAVMDSTCTDVGKGHVGTRRPDQDLTEATTDLRKAGLVGWDEIDDRTRHLIRNTGWDSLADGLAAHLEHLRLDPYMNGTLPVLVVESESVAGVLDGLADRYRVPIVPTRGQSAGFLRTDVLGFIRRRTVAVGYVGDYDKAGGDIEANSATVLHEVLDVISWERLALTEAQVTGHGLPTEQRYDKRTRTTNTACEVEALPQVELMAVVETFLIGWLPEPLDHVHVRESDERYELRGLLS